MNPINEVIRGGLWDRVLDVSCYTTPHDMRKPVHSTISITVYNHMRIFDLVYDKILNR